MQKTNTKSGLKGNSVKNIKILHVVGGNRESTQLTKQTEDKINITIEPIKRKKR